MTPSGDPRLILGIDLGTSNSLAAVKGRDAAIVLRDQTGQALTPSIAFFPADGSAALIGDAAKDQLLEQPSRTVFSIKRLIGQAGESARREAEHLPYPVVLSERQLARVEIDGRQYSPEEISAMILTEVKTKAEAALGAEVADVVITVPAYFDDAQRQATKDAASLAGLNCLRIINEPTAAALAYGIDGSKDGIVLVYDLGGGTFDVSILKIKDGVFRVLSTAGNTHLGGDDFDRLLADRVLSELRVRSGINHPESALRAIKHSAENLKIQLSDDVEATLEIDLGKGEATSLKITRTEFEELATPLVEETLACCQRAIQDAGIAMDEIDDIVLVGGSTRIPLVRQMLANLTKKTPQTDIDPDQAIAIGAALQADVLAGENRSLLLLDVIPLSLGIETMGGVVSKLIMRNATIPTSVTEEFSTQADNQTGVNINIYQGERELTEDCRHLGSFKLSGIPPAPAGLPRIAVTFLIDADGVLAVTAKEIRTGIEARIQVVPSFGLTRDEVNSIMHESLEHAGDDMAKRETIELRNKAQAMVKGTRSSLKLADLPPDQTYGIEKAAREVETQLDKADDAALSTAIEALSQLTQMIADDVISSAVAKALNEKVE